jgi:single-strand DNA-binding protein
MFNQFTGIGNLTADPESKFTAKGTQVANFTVCCDSGYGDNKKTEFVRCVAWDKLAKICTDYFRKGQRVMIQGAMETRKWQDKKGVDRYTTEIILQTAKNLSPRDENRQSSQPPQSDPGYSGEDVPF